MIRSMRELSADPTTEIILSIDKLVTTENGREAIVSICNDAILENLKDSRSTNKKPSIVG